MRIIQFVKSIVDVGLIKSNGVRHSEVIQSFIASRPTNWSASQQLNSLEPILHTNRRTRNKRISKSFLLLFLLSFREIIGKIHKDAIQSACFRPNICRSQLSISNYCSVIR